MGIASAVWKPVSGPSAARWRQVDDAQSANRVNTIGKSDITDLRVAIILIKLLKTKSIIDSFLSGTEAVGAIDRGRVHRLHCESGNGRR